jgi:hypothetical protein
MQSELEAFLGVHAEGFVEWLEAVVLELQARAAAQDTLPEYDEDALGDTDFDDSVDATRATGHSAVARVSSAVVRSCLMMLACCSWWG